MKKSGFIDGAIIATLAIFISKFLGIIYVTPFHSIVDYNGAALYGYAYQIYNLFLMISTAGIPLAISKLTSEYNSLGKNNEKNYVFKASQKIIIIFSIISFLTCFIFAPTIAEILIGTKDSVINSISEIAFVIRCVSFAILVVPTLSIIRGYLQGNGFMGASSFSQVIEQVVRVLVIIVGSFLAYKVFNLSLKVTIGIAVFGACIGAIIGLIYLLIKLFSIKKDITVNDDKLKKEDKKTIITKIIIYAIPFIIINIANSLYSITDLSLLIRGLNYLGFKATEVTTISGIFTTYVSKMNTIITSIATGIALSLVPSIARSNAKKDYKDINDKFNKTIQIFMYVALPLAIFMCIFSKQIWTIFFGYKELGVIILRFSVIVAAVDALYIMICNGLQGLNQTKLIYISVLLGLGINLILDIPLMFAFNEIGIYPYYGTIAATLIGYIISLFIPFIALKSKYNLNYNNTFKKVPKLILSYLLMIFLSFLACGIIRNVNNRILLTLIIGLIGIILLVIYYIINKKEINEILGKDISNKLFRKKREKDE